MTIQGRVFAITGATGATGTAAARALAEHGAALALLSTNQSKLDSLAGALGLPAARVLTLAADLRKAGTAESAAGAVAAQFGRMDGLIHLVGGWTGGKTLAETGVAEFETMLAQHAWTTFYLLRAFGPYLAANGWGRVIVVSASTVLNPPGKSGVYVAAKAAQEALVLTFAKEFRDSRVTANILQVRSINVDGKGQGTTPDKIVAAMLDLCSDEAGGMNGARIPLFE
jgi:NAD(P)-dependent dehydrogenase (short-subunit alcohol dehydrogenase family)